MTYGQFGKKFNLDPFSLSWPIEMSWISWLGSAKRMPKSITLI